MVTGRYDVTISRLMPIYNGNRARQGAHQGLFVRQVEERRKHLFRHITTFSQEFLQQDLALSALLQSFGGGDGAGDEGDDGGGWKLSIN